MAAASLASSETWTVRGLVQTLKDAEKLFEDATLFELCLECFSAMDNVFKLEKQVPIDDSL